MNESGPLFPPTGLELFYLGPRDYVNGLTLVEEMLAGYMRVSGKRPEHIKKFQINKWVRTHAHLECWETARLRGNRRVREASARIDLRTGDAAESLLLFAEASAPVTERIEEYDRKAYVASASDDNSGETIAQLANINNITDLLRGVVEVNHQYVIRQAAEVGVEKGVSWAYMTGFPYLLDDSARETLSLQYGVPKMFDAKGLRYSVRTFHLDGAMGENEGAMCFFFPLPQE